MYLDYDNNDIELNTYNQKKKIWDRSHVIYDNKKITELFSKEEDRFFMTNEILEQFLNKKENLNL